MTGMDGARASSGGGFTADRFGVPRHYLELLVGPEAAEVLLADARATEAFTVDGDRLPSMLFLNLCLEHMRRSGDESLGAAPAPVARGAFGLLVAAASQGDTFGEALRRFAAAAPVVRPDLVVQVVSSRRGLAVSFDCVGPRDARRDLVAEIFALTAHCGFRWLTGQRLRPAQLRVAAFAPPLGPTLLRPVILGTASRRDRGVTITYEAADADLPLRAVKYQHWAAHELGEFTALMDEAAQSLASQPAGAVTDILAQVRAAIGPDAWDETSAARALGMSPATLRRRLAEAGSSFREVSSDARRRAAASLLATEHSLEDIAAQLGFSDARSLRRACKAWFGMAPAEYRRAVV